MTRSDRAAVSAATPKPHSEQGHTQTWHRLVTGAKDPQLGYEAGGGAFVLAPDNETVVARFPSTAQGAIAFRAVNSHDALVKALEGLLEVCPCQNGCAAADMTCATNVARAALSLARNEQQNKKE